MHPQSLAILKGLVCVAWADGHVDAKETELIEALLVTFAATPSEALEVRRFASQPRTLADVPINDLSYDDRRSLLSQAVLLSFADGEQSDAERALIEGLCEALRIPSVEAEGIVKAAESEGRNLVSLLTK